MKTKFKIGDRVKVSRCVKGDRYFCAKCKNNINLKPSPRTGTVVEILTDTYHGNDPHTHITVKFDDLQYCDIDEDCINENTAMTKRIERMTLG